MAEFVQQSIEEMLPELEQMERVGLFTDSETRAILKKRKMHEYKLRRQTKHKEDFLAYIQYEVNLLALIRKRRESTGYSFKKLEIDIAIVQRIHKLFKLAAFRFQEDVNIWLSYIEFCKKRHEKSSVSKVFTRMLQVHNKKPGLWVLAAKWEFEDNYSSENARSLLQRGIRFNSESKELWLEYFRMELLYTDKLRKRKLILTGDDDVEEEDSDPVLQCKIAPVVYRKAIEARPDDVDFMLSFIPISQLFDFTQFLTDDIFSDLKSHHGLKEVAWNAIARNHLQIIPDEKAKVSTKQEKNAVIEAQVDKCFAVFEEGVEKINSEMIWDLYLKTCLERLTVKSSSDLKKKAIERAFDVFQRASDSQKLSANMYLEWVSFLTNTAQIQQAVTTSEKATQTYPADVFLWKSRLHLMVTCNRPEDDVYNVFNEATKNVKAKDSWPLWKLVLDWALTINSEKLESLLQRGVLECEEICVPVKVFYLQWIALTKSVDATRQLYKQLSQSKPLSLEFFTTYIDLENSKTNLKMKKLRHTYEDAIREFGEVDIDLWLDYITMELMKGKPQNAGDLYCRAVKTLDGKLTDRFITKYTLLQTGHL